MAFSLYDATVASYLQILGAVGRFLEKSLAHFRERGIDPADHSYVKISVLKNQSPQATVP
jgi:hypothetical protein